MNPINPLSENFRDRFLEKKLGFIQIPIAHFQPYLSTQHFINYIYAKGNDGSLSFQPKLDIYNDNFTCIRRIFLN